MSGNHTTQHRRTANPIPAANTEQRRHVLRDCEPACRIAGDLDQRSSRMYSRSLPGYITVNVRISC